MQQHVLEFSQTLIPSFSVEFSYGKRSNSLSAFELSMMCGAMVHPASSFAIGDEGVNAGVKVRQWPE